MSEGEGGDEGRKQEAENDEDDSENDRVVYLVSEWILCIDIVRIAGLSAWMRSFSLAPS